ncbi:hypothetical protein WL29_01310 [Burkholderia ubonensis]|uniref:Uncharacterized protein n=1 Tax=Burkholderia ubonensis TaxID=101571 RepID=A0A106PZS4_9BURK|nr:hypothetical protein WL29_01310 [Burkholderia ubonensis]
MSGNYDTFDRPPWANGRLAPLTHQCDGKKVLRSKTPDLVCQDSYTLMLTHAAIRRLMCEAAQDSGQ